MQVKEETKYELFNNNGEQVGYIYLSSQKQPNGNRIWKFSQMQHLDISEMETVVHHMKKARGY